MGWLLKLAGGSKMMLGMGIAMLVLAGSAAAMGNLYLGKRDELAQEKILTSVATARGDQYFADLVEEENRRKFLEAARLDLQTTVRDLEARGVETITEIREVFRDRNTIVNNPVAVECAAEPMPVAVVELLCEASGVRSGACASLHEGPNGPIVGLSSTDT